MKHAKRHRTWPMFRRITKPQLLRACKRVIELAQQYKPGEHHREMGYDGLLFGYLDGHFGKMERQRHIRRTGSSRPKRLDFRQGGARPVVIEFAVRTPGRNEIYASQNKDEIRKLARQHKASARYLLLLDLSKKRPLNASGLRDTYRQVNAGPGKFIRKPVQVVYVHPDLVESFIWRP